MALHDQLSALAAELASALTSASDERALEELRIAYLGRSGKITEIRRGIGKLPPDERPTAGKSINDAVAGLEAQFAAAQQGIELRKLDAELERTLDVTLWNVPAPLGSFHPIRKTIDDACTYFVRHGFAVLLGPEVDTTRHNFDALNIPPDHPAREGFDSFYLRPDLLLRPHTSPMQIRAMEAYPPPIAIVVPGKCYRRDAVDARHLYQFNQIEGLQVGEGIHFGHLRGMLTGMCRELFGPRQEVRFRPSFFPFTEPSAEIDTTCPGCGGGGESCRTCGGSGWIEIGGSGMVHPNVLRAVGYDPDVVSGWAFGCGIERLAMVRYDIGDIREFIWNEPSFLEQLA
ncbi:MAG: phenylalanine--tRNA ligase subunit alpha [Candidatus Eremiobacteraeota bacterium]|nr:phenylalanine--tRNA ligase subunit alpha [Candidatus Eremiobacteraeota bacterium]